MKILVTDPLAPQGLEVLQHAPGFEVEERIGLKPEEIKKILGDYHAWVIRSGTKVTADVLETARNLKVIGRAGIGVDNVDVEAASRKGIVVMNTPGGNNVTTAEHTISLMLALARHIPQAAASLKKGEWKRNKFVGVELCNKTLGIIGLGNVGRIVAERALGLRMKVLAHDPYVPPENAARLGVEMVNLEEIYEKSDFVTVHVPLTSETRGLINRDAIAKMKQGVRIINCARGGIVDEKDLEEALRAGKVAGAALDVFVDEPPPADHPLIKMEQVVTTPHLGASTDEAQLNVAIAVAEQIIDYLTRGVIRYAVNVPAVSAELLSALRPYLTLGEKLGSLQVQMFARLPQEIYIEYSGVVTQYDVAPLTLAVLKGLLSPAMESSVNYVNAPVVARERGIKVVESKSSRATDFASSITVRGKSRDKEIEIEGAIFGNNNPRIVKINNFYLEAVPEGHIIILHNRDTPGVVGTIGTLLGEKGINIAGLELGREKVGGMAIALVHVDEPVPKETLAALRKLPNIITVDLVKL
ncbi:MAG: phosphoglycerate dehydrogenase [Deltaproteobacteria bacterium]|nr:phosphoglycerate dehydrogenase [Deltaproteobacteria bacterium]